MRTFWIDARNLIEIDKIKEYKWVNVVTLRSNCKVVRWNNGLISEKLSRTIKIEQHKSFLGVNFTVLVFPRKWNQSKDQNLSKPHFPKAAQRLLLFCCFKKIYWSPGFIPATCNGAGVKKILLGKVEMCKFEEML